MKDGPLWFSVVPHEDRAFPHELEVGPIPSYFVFSSISGPILRDDKEPGRSRELVGFFKSKVVNLTSVIFQVQDDSDFTLGINYTVNAIDLCIILFS